MARETQTPLRNEPEFHYLLGNLTGSALTIYDPKSVIGT